MHLLSKTSSMFWKRGLASASNASCSGSPSTLPTSVRKQWRGDKYTSYAALLIAAFILQPHSGNYPCTCWYETTMHANTQSVLIRFGCQLRDLLVFEETVQFPYHYWDWCAKYELMGILYSITNTCVHHRIIAHSLWMAMINNKLKQSRCV